MSWLASVHVLPALATGVSCGALAAFGPGVIARLPEPAPEPAAAVDEDGTSRSAPVRGIAAATAKEPYADIAALPHLALWLALGSALVGAAFGAELGWTGALVYLAPLVPIGAVLLVIDWRTTLLSSRIIHPTYVLLAVLVPCAALLDQDLHSLYRAGVGWLLVGGWFWMFWWLLAAWGFGDVRLARVLGPALGYLGWAHLVLGLCLMLVLGAVGGVAISVANRSLRRRFPYGPFMLVGAALAVIAAPQLARALGY